MGNAIADRVKIGTVGELLVQARLLQYDVQAAPPIKDSGNDLIAVRGESFRGVQVKTTAGRRRSHHRLPEHYHILAIVHLRLTEQTILLDESSVYLVPRDLVDRNQGRAPRDLERFLISSDLVDRLFD